MEKMAIYLLDEIKSVVIYGFAKEKSKSLLKVTQEIIWKLLFCR